MPIVNIGEKDFAAVASAALSAWSRGDKNGARVLDRLARKINFALTAQNPVLRAGRKMFGHGPSGTWRDVPSVLPLDDADSSSTLRRQPHGSRRPSGEGA